MRSKLLTNSLLVVLFNLSVLADDKQTSGKKWVFAHYMVCFFDTVEAHEYEIALAQRNGIDGFALNCGEWLQKDKKTGEWIDGNYVVPARKPHFFDENAV